jgi:hypothetical protein
MVCPAARNMHPVACNSLPLESHFLQDTDRGTVRQNNGRLYAMKTRHMYAVFAVVSAGFGIWCIFFTSERGIGAFALVFATAMAYRVWFAGAVARALEMARAGKKPSLWRTPPSRARLVLLHGLLFSAGMQTFLRLRARRHTGRRTHSALGA